MIGRVAFAAVAFWLIWQGQAAACLCAGGEDVRERFRSASVVFDGVIRSSRIVPNPEGTGIYLSTVFEITRPLKGARRATREISHSLTFERLCGVEFVPGERVLVFEFRNTGLGPNYCFMRSASVLDGDTSLREAVVDEIADMIGEAVGAVLAEGPMAQFRDPPAGSEEGEAEEEKPAEAEPVQPAARKRPAKGLDRSSALFLDLRALSVKSLEEDLQALGARSRQIIKDHKTQAATRRLLSSATSRANGFEEYLDHEHMEMAYAVVSRLAPLEPEGPVGRARALYMLGRFAEAKPHLDEALRLNAKHPLAHKLRAHIMLIEEGRPARGVTDYSRLGPRGFLPPEASPSVFEDGPRRVSVALSGRRVLGLSFYGAEIDKFTAARAILARADFSHASIWEGTFQGADLSGANFVSASIRGNFDGARLLRINAPYAGFGGSFRRANLSRAKAPHSAWHGDLSGTVLTNADLSFADLSNAQLQGTNLRRAKTSGIKLKGARIDCATKLPVGTDIRRAQAIPVSPECGGVRQNRDFSGMDWEKADFSNLDLPGANFSGGTYQYAEFDGGNFAGADFSTALFDSTDFYGANLQRADFSRTTAFEDEISRAFGLDDEDDFKFVGAWFAGADLTDADFSNSPGVGQFHGWKAGGKLYRPAKLLRTNFSGAAIHLGSFLVSDLFGDFPAEDDADISTAIFDGTRIRCQFGHWHGAQLVVKGESLPAETRDFYPPEMLAKYTPEQRAVLEERNAFFRKEKTARRELFKKAVLKERDVVQHIAKAWPTAKFEQCEAYFAESKASAQP